MTPVSRQTMRLRAWHGALLAGAAMLFISPACNMQTKDLPPYMVTFHFEAAPDQAGTEAKLPKSGLPIRYVKDPKMASSDLLKIELFQADSQVGRQYAFSFQFKPGFGYNKVYQQTSAHQGIMLYAVVGNKPVAAWRVDGPISNGNLMMWSEVPDDQAEEITLDMQESLAKLQDIQRKK